MLILSLKLLYRKNPMIFIVIVFTQFITAISIIYVIAKIGADMYAFSTYRDNLRTFTVDWNPDTDGNIGEKIAALSENKDISSVKIETPRINYEEYVFMPPIYCFPFAEETDETADYIIYSVLSVSTEDKNRKSVELYGVNFQIRELVDQYTQPYSVIPYHSLLNNDIPISKVYVEYSEIDSESDMAVKSFQVKSVFAGIAVTDPVERNFTFEEVMSGNRILSVAMCVLALISEIYLYLFLIKKCSRDYGVYMLCGCTRAKTVAIALTQIVVLYALQFAAVMLIYKAVLRGVIIKIEPLMLFTLNINSYVKALLLSLLPLLLVFAFILYNNFIKNTTNKEMISND